MKNHKSILSRVSPSLCSNATILVLALSAATSVNADDGSTTTAYVDSIHKWGAWELDIEPAAGGLQQPSAQALNSRDARVALRTNSFSAVAPRDRSPVIFVPSPAPAPSAPPLPVTPPTPPGKGGPFDGLF